MMSELGLVYFLVRAASRKTVKVWPVSLGLCAISAAAYLERDLVRRRFALLHTLYGAADELLGVRLQVQHLVGWYRVQYALQPGCVWPMQKEFLPEAIGQLRVFIVLLHLYQRAVCYRLAACAL